MQQHLVVPPALVQSTYNFESSAIRKQWQRRNVASPASVSEICFRIINLRAAVKDGDMTDPELIRQTALEIDGDLETWRAGVPVNWKYTVTSLAATDTDTDTDTCFDGKTHVYPNLWIAEAWINWRILRILVSQIVVQTEGLRLASSSRMPSEATHVIQHLSTDICISVSSFTGTSRKVQPSLLLSTFSRRCKSSSPNPPLVHRLTASRTF
jgi:hypothetical protein